MNGPTKPSPPEIRDYLAELPLTLQQDNLCFVHGSPHSQHEYLLPDTSAFIAPGTGSGHRSRYPLLRPHPRPLCAQPREQFPHPQSGCSIQSATHRLAHPLSRPETLRERLRCSFEPLREQDRHPPIHSATPVPTLKRIINAGSVGEPRHGRPNATYVSMTLPVKRSPCAKSSTTTPKPAPPLSKKAYPPSLLGDWPKGWNMPKKPMIPTHVCER
jgi:diadenosine tetraphosphatase ApaH/serine/threonine PP2A family protein phosphatase